MEDKEVAKLKADIFNDFHAEDAAKRLLLEADLIIQSGKPLPPALRALIGDCLECVVDNDPLRAFLWLRRESSTKQGRPTQETDREWLEIAAEIHSAHKAEGLPLYGNADRNLQGSAFEAVAANRIKGPPAAIAKAARRFKERWEKHKNIMADDRLNDLGYYRRK